MNRRSHGSSQFFQLFFCIISGISIVIIGFKNRNDFQNEINECLNVCHKTAIHFKNLLR